MKGKRTQSTLSSQVMSRSLAESFDRVEKTMSMGSTYRQSSPDRIGISAKAPQATAKEVVLKRQLADLSKEFNALERQHNKASSKLDEVLEEVKRLRTCHDDKEKEALSLRRALERLRLEKDDESAAMATDKAYICKLETKVAAQATSLEQLEKHSVLRARNKELQESVRSLHAVLASTEAELGGRNEEIEKLHIALRVRAEDLRRDGLSDSKPSLLLELANEQQERMSIALKLAETVQEHNRQHEQIEILEERLEAKTADGVRAAQQSEEKYKALRQETQKQLHAFENEITDLKARVQDREARTVDLRSDLKEARAEKQRLQESLQREQQATSEQRAQLKEGERRLAEEQTRVKQLTAALAAATHASEDAKKIAKHSLEELRAEMAAAVQKEMKRTDEARKRIVELEDELEEVKRQMQIAVSLAKKEAASDLEKQRARASEDVTRVRKQMLADHEQVVKQLAKDLDGIRRALAAEMEKVAECERALGEHRRREQEMREEINGLHAELDHFTEVNGEIQSDAQAEQRQRVREEKRASAFARQVAALEAQLTGVRKDKAANDSALKVKLEEALSELRATIEERDQLKSTLQETKSKTHSSTTSHSTLVAENRQLRQQADELARAKSAAQKSASEQAAGLRVKLEQAQVQVREWEAAAARLEAKNDRLQALVDAERKSSAALAKQCTSALRALHTASPPHRARASPRRTSDSARFTDASEHTRSWAAPARARESAPEPILLNSEARDLELSSEERSFAISNGIASRFYDSVDAADLWMQHVSVEGTFKRGSDARRAERDSYGEEQVKQVVPQEEDSYELRPRSRTAPHSDGSQAVEAPSREASAGDVSGGEPNEARARSARSARRASVGVMAVSETGLYNRDPDSKEAARPSALDALESLTGFDIDNPDENGRSSQQERYSGRKSSGLPDSAGTREPVLSLEDLADLMEPYSPPISDGMPSEDNREPYEMQLEESEWERPVRSVHVAKASSRPASSLGGETERSRIPDDDED